MKCLYCGDCCLRLKDGDSVLRAFKNNLREEFLRDTSVDRLNDNKIQGKKGL